MIDKILEARHLAWMRYRHRADSGETYLQICDSESEGAFKVWDARAINEAIDRAETALDKKAERTFRSIADSNYEEGLRDGRPIGITNDL